ncbi:MULTISPECIES: phage tail tape measure protein [unclassified Pseudomonas]|uniref:phage tail tape measure protein n=1 Tax=unclassified Pseudomonas TaxID=196821 RepID=UPI000BD89C68|nr:MULTISPECIES: phage tail tape measure protein [unclassified Pseudomonas]PVZ19920.1 lambda family phage tail tape measure protein [Pseudomonas sp. URIL14HWK12:I12]PVZ26986.1 lambda family phage tail tape measure protein [Pseudomonas sp. URIL14HWK12:I10]PVZ37875.1 lambda family phage tail tape measure protein [Pseudomonas sp. URIL14HWK12:I11]SNZ05319.1 phage tail tape measure protein, lambda family [Pseudomonas sp. URIL14HWK12:I9]
MTIGSIAQLGIEINSDSARTASDQLDRLVQSGSRTNQELAALNLKQQHAARSMTEMAQSAAKAAQELQSLNLKQSYSAQALNDLVTSSGQAVTELRQLTSQQAASTQQMEGLRSAVLSSANAFQAATASLQGFMAQNQQLAASSTKAATGIKTEKDELAKLLGQIDPTVAALGRLDEMERKLQSYRAKGLIDADTFTDYKTKLDQARESTGRLGDTMQKTGVSAKQTAAALRGLPAQFTDIVVSLQGGQAPLTVLLQQGGQIKDMFGGIGPAAKALGGYVAGLVNPFTVAAAAVGVLAVAYYKGSAEADEFRKALVLTGNAAGTNSTQLAGMAQAVSRSVGTVGAAADVLTQLASTGKLTADNFELIAKAALKMQSATGKAVSETVAEFAKLADDPVKASLQLNDSMGYLTASVFQQIEALQHRGDTVGAANVAEQAYAEALTTRADKAEEDIGLIETAWKGAGDMAKGAWDAFLDIGREDSFEQKMQKLANRINNTNPILAQFGGGRAAGDPEWAAGLQAEVDRAEKARREMFATQNSKAGASAFDWITTELKTAVPKAQQLATALEEVSRKVAKARAQGYDVSDQDVEYLRKQAADKFKDPKTAASAVDLTGYNSAQNALKALVSDYANSQRELEAQQKAGIVSAQDYYAQRTTLLRAEKEQVNDAYDAEIKALEAVKDKSSTTATQRIQIGQKIDDARAEQIKAAKAYDSQMQVLAENERTRVATQAASLNSYVSALNLQTEALRKAGERAVIGLGMGDRQNALARELNAQADRYAQQARELANQRSDAALRGKSQADIDQEVGPREKALAEENEAATAQIKKNYSDITAAQSEWLTGANAAWQNYRDTALNVTGQMRTAFTSLFDGLTDATVDWAFGADESFGDVAVSFAKMLAKMAVQAAASSVFSAIGGSALGSVFSGGATASAGSTAAGYTGSAYANWAGSAYSAGGYTGDGGKYEAKGIVHGGEVVIRKEVVSQPGMKDYLLGINARGYADGGYVGSATAPMVARQASGGLSVSVYAPVTVGDQGQGVGQIDQAQLQKSLQQQMQAVAEKAVADSWRAGGTSYRQTRNA